METESRVKFKKISSKRQEWRSYDMMLRYIKLKAENGVGIIGDASISRSLRLYVPSHFHLLQVFGTRSLGLARPSAVQVASRSYPGPPTQAFSQCHQVDLSRHEFMLHPFEDLCVLWVQNPTYTCDGLRGAHDTRQVNGNKRRQKQTRSHL